MTATRKAGDSSFRDPSGFIFYRDGEVFRQVNRRYSEAFDLLTRSGLYDLLVKQRLLVSHDVVSKSLTGDCHAIIRPKKIPFITYPYEWCFDQLRDAAVATLDVQLAAMSKGMTLKDATAFNIQFLHGKPIHIDTLSFDAYQDGQPWMAYNEFCRHFLAPLVLCATRDLRLGALSSQFLHGIPLDLASELLPRKTKWNPAILTHIHLHAKLSKGQSGEGKTANVRKEGLELMLTSLRKFISNLQPKGSSAWSRYYANCTYTEGDLEEKKQIVDGFLNQLPSGTDTLCDLGGNTGMFSRLASIRGIRTLSVDSDPWAVNHAYLESKKVSDKLLLPLVQDLTNPSSAIGWRNRERDSFIARAKSDAIMALALVHHLSIGANVPFHLVAELFADVGEWAIVEFVPPTDPMSKTLMRAREQVFDWYTQENFEQEFSRSFEILDRKSVGASGRTLYFMRRLASR